MNIFEIILSIAGTAVLVVLAVFLMFGIWWLIHVIRFSVYQMRKNVADGNSAFKGW